MPYHRSSGRPCWLLPTLLLGLLIRAPAAADFLDPELALLQYAKVPTDDRGLLAYLRRQPTPAPVNLALLLSRLGSPHFAQREKATHDLIAAGAPALPGLREASNHADPEIARRAADCLAAIQHALDRQPECDFAAIRLLVRRAPPRAIATLLHYLPFAPSAEIEEEVWFGLDALTVKAGRIDPSLSAALRDPQPARRAVAACLLGRLGDADQKTAVRMCLSDKDANVRLRAAQGLLAGMDKAGLETLVELLTEADVFLAWQAEELLHFLAGETAPEQTVGADGEQAQKCRDAWRLWLGQEGDKADPVLAMKEPRRPGLVMVCPNLPQFPRPGLANLPPATFSLFVLGCQGRKRWRLFYRDRTPVDVQLLPGNCLLLVETDNAVRQRDLAGRHLWQWTLPEKEKPLSCRRLPGGRTWIATSTRLREVLADGTVCRQRDWPVWLRRVRRLPDGRVLALGQNASNARDEDAALWSLDSCPPSPDHLIHHLGRGTRAPFPLLEALPDGQYLVSSEQNDTVLQIAQGRHIGTGQLGLDHAIRLRHGHFLGHKEHRLLQKDSQGRVVWEAILSDEVAWLKDVLGLVRLGFAPSDLDIDNSVAYRTRCLRSKNDRLRWWSARALGHMGLQAEAALPDLGPLLRDPNREVAVEAAWALGRLGPRARPAIPALVEALDASVAQGLPCANALAQIGPAALPALRKALKEERPEKRRGAIQALALLHDEIPAPIPELSKATRDKDPDVRRMAVDALGYLVQDHPAYLPALCQAAADSNREVRKAALEHLVRVGPAAAPAIPALLPYTRPSEVPTPSDELRPLALQILAEVGRKDPTLVPILRAALSQGKDRHLQQSALAAVGRLGANGRQVVPALIDLLHSVQDQKTPKAMELQTQVIKALGPLGRYDDEAARVLVCLLQRCEATDKEFCCTVVEALTKTGSRGAAAVPQLLAILRKAETSRVAQEALATMGTASIPGLVGLIENGTPEQREAAVLSLFHMGAPAAPTVSVLAALVHSPDYHLRHAAMIALGRIGPAAASAIPDLLVAVKNDLPDPAAVAARSLGEIGVADTDAVSVLIKVFRDQERPVEVRAAVAWALGRLGPQAKTAVGALLESLREPDEERAPQNRRLLSEYCHQPEEYRERSNLFCNDLRGCVLLSLGRIGPSARAAVPELYALCADDAGDAFERWASAIALGQIGPDAAHKVPGLLRLLRNEETPAEVQAGIALALGKLAPQDAAVVAALKEAMTEGQPPLRLAARRALEQRKP